MTMSGVTETEVGVHYSIENELDPAEGLNSDGYEVDGDDDEEEDGDEQPDSDPDTDALGLQGDVPEWVSLENHPVPTSQRIQTAFARLATAGKSHLTILLLGRTGSGKSSTANSLFGSRMFAVQPFSALNYMPVQPTTVSKRKGGVVLTVIDTVGLVESDSVSYLALRQIAYAARNRCPIDVVLYVDRMDMPRVEDLDCEVFEGLTNTFGPQIWKHVMIGLTRSEVRNPSPHTSYDGYVLKRVNDIRAAMQKSGAQDATLPFALIENGSRCQKNAENEQILPNECVWIPTLIESAVDLALLHLKGYMYYPHKKSNLLQKLLIIPLVFITQILFKNFVIDPIIEEDGVRGDQYGPFDLETQKEERRRLEERKRIQRQNRESALRRVQKALLRMQHEREGVAGSDSDDDDDFY